MLIKTPQDWEMPEREATPESAYLNRRQILLGAGFLGAQTLLHGATDGKSLYPAQRNNEFTLDRPITEQAAAEGYNNFYEFDAQNKENVRNLVGKFQTRPWKVEITGLVQKPMTLDIDDIEHRFQLEERLYRFRCVEAWSMAVPWTGFKLSDLVKVADPKPEAKFIRFISVKRPDQMPGINGNPLYPWPYFEGLRMDEAMNPLAFVTTGLYGKPIAKQNGAPIRMVVPWKYGYKGAKSIVKIEFVAKQPGTFWNQLNSNEYGFYSNVNPKKSHPRWSQAIERVIPTGERKATLMYNGYEKYVAGLYDGKEF